MLIDTHLHESKYSLDSFVSLSEIVAKAKAIGLHGICITDHESNEIMAEAKKLAKEMNFIIIVGAEFLTIEGDMTVFGLDKLPKERIHANELVHLVEQAGGIAIASHPYRQNNRGMGDFIRDIDKLWGVEAFNGSTPKELNQKAYELAIELGIPTLGGSDAHNANQVGKFVSVMPDWVKDEASFIKAIKSKLVHPAVFENGLYTEIKNYDDLTKVG
jgi:predicted metal-dependent phosphoesterase TrpH